MMPTMNERKDGRPLVTEFPVTAMDEIDYVPAGERLTGGLACTMRFSREDDGWEYDSA